MAISHGLLPMELLAIQLEIQESLSIHGSPMPRPHSASKQLMKSVVELPVVELMPL